MEGLGTEVGPTATLVGRPTPYVPPRSKLFPLLPARVPEKEGGARHWRHLLSRASAGGLCLKEKRPWAHTAQSLEPRTYGEEEGELSLSGGSCELSLEGR